MDMSRSVKEFPTSKIVRQGIFFRPLAESAEDKGPFSIKKSFFLHQNAKSAVRRFS
jgi:hypothetical protein